MGLPIAPKHIRHYIRVGRLFARHMSSDWGDDLSSSPEEAEGDEETRSLAEDLEALGPTYIKLGQILSTRPDVVPDPVRADLERLQDNVEEVPFEDVKERIELELHAKLDELFGSFERRPLGSASLAQVHRATLRDGRPVAVKVLRPSVRAKVHGDLDAMTDIADWLEANTQLERKHGLASAVREFDAALRRELDYRIEAENLVRMASILEDYPRIVVPGVIPDYCTAGVLTMERLQGRSLGRLHPLATQEKDLTGLAEDLVRCYLDQTMIHGFVHADPHPGNLLLTEDGRLGVLDLGMVTFIPQRLRGDLLKLLLAIASGDDSGTVDVAERIGQRLDEYDRTSLERSIAAMVAMNRDANVEGLQLGAIVMETMRVASEAGLRLPAEFGIIGKTILNLEGSVNTLDSTLEPTEVLKRHAPVMILERAADAAEPGRVLRKALSLKDIGERLPERLDDILDRVGSGEFEIAARLRGEEGLIAALTRVANRLTQGIVLAALLIGAALIMDIRTEWTLLGYPAIAIVFFLLAGLGAAVLLYQIGFRSHHRPNDTQR